ncbi:MAG: zinc ABC transporter substrate-binding protein [Deltaproteobacteria bacterium]|nr:zinc ABC transporter substrate-binding protein [Deltaproteobacteria bacterium]
MKNNLGICGLVLMLTLLMGISVPSPSMGGGPLKVTVSILPQKYFVEKIGGDRVEVSVMVLPGANPATYEPKPRQMVDLTESRIYFAIGVPFETVWLDKFAHASPKMEIVPTQAGIEKIPMAPKHTHDGEDHPGGPAAHSGGKDPHIWLSPPLVMLQARNILRALIKADPPGRADYEARYQEFIEGLVELDLRIAGLFSDRGMDNRFMVYHPAWGYFAKAYGLMQIPVETEGKGPTPKALQRLIADAQHDGIRAIFVQPQFSVKSAETIARAINGRVIAADPLALDWQTNLLRVAEQFKAALR